jgi:putative transposase
MEKNEKRSKRQLDRNITAEDMLKTAMAAWAKENYHGDPEVVLGTDGLLNRLQKGLLEAMLQGEMTHHLGYEKHAPEGDGSGNSRNGSSEKTVKTGAEELRIEVPRDRNGSFEPVIVPKRRRRLGRFDDQIIALYTRGLTLSEIAEYLKEMYQVEVSKELISAITDVVSDEVKEWRSRALDAVYPILFLDALRIKGKHNGVVGTRVVYVAIGVNMEGKKEILGLWACESEGAKFWAGLLNELKNRGVQDVLVCCVDGLKGFPEAINAVFPNTEVQLCIVHLIRSSMKMVAYSDMKAVAKDLKPVYTAATAEAAEQALAEFDKIWGEKYPMVAKAWRTVWGHVVPFFKFPADIRRAIYTTNAIESVNSSIRHIINNRNLFPSDEAIYKLLYLALTNAAKKWTMPIKQWARV